ncbi:DUF4340 domain-containing protein [Chloroflexota bacterium]
MRLRSILILLTILLALGGYFYFSNIPEPPVKPEPRLFVWDIEMEVIQRIEISLPREDKSQAFIKIPEEDKFPWYFDDPQRSDVDTNRWGGGIPLLLSGPGVDRVIAENATQEKLAEFGLVQPQMEIILTLEDGDTMNIIVGDATLDGHALYVQAPNTNDVALVDYTWYMVLERLVKEPPYVPPEAE